MPRRVTTRRIVSAEEVRAAISGLDNLDASMHTGDFNAVTRAAEVIRALHAENERLKHKNTELNMFIANWAEYATSLEEVIATLTGKRRKV